MDGSIELVCGSYISGEKSGALQAHTQKPISMDGSKVTGPQPGGLAQKVGMNNSRGAEYQH